MAYLPFLMVPFDVEASVGLIGGTDGIKVAWNVLLVVQVICVWVIFPMCIVYYESYENDVVVRPARLTQSR